MNSSKSAGELRREPIRVLIVDDSTSIRRLIREVLNSQADIEVVGEAEDPIVARSKIKQLDPDVLTLDVEMPRMDGITFLKNLMRLRPMPVIMVSTLTQEGASTTLQALELGAIDYVGKPASGSAAELRAHTDELVRKVRIAAQGSAYFTRRANNPSRASLAPKVPSVNPADIELIAIGASTGGVEAVHSILQSLGGNLPPMVVSQHILKTFGGPFAERLDRVSQLNVAVARDGAPLKRGHVYVAPGDRHLSVRKSSLGLTARVLDKEKVNGHRPSVDVMFDSVSRSVGASAAGVLLTGMGNDGAEGLLRMKKQGAITVAQDEASSVVWGMPKAAVALGAASHVLALSKVASFLTRIASS